MMRSLHQSDGDEQGQFDFYLFLRGIIMKEGTEMQEEVRKIFEGQQTVSICINQEDNESVTFYKEDYESLLPYRWLRTQAVDLLIKLQLEQQKREIRKIQYSQPKSQLNRFYIKAMDAFVVTLIMTDQEDFVLESLEPLGLFSQQTKYLLIPLNTENSSGSHWLLGLLIRQQGYFTLTIFDSGSSYQVGESLSKRLSHLYQILTKSQANILLQPAQNLIYQSNSFDCGIFTVGYSQYILKQVVNSLEENRKVNFTTLSSQYKYILSNSTHTRDRYRRVIQQLIINSITK